MQLEDLQKNSARLENVLKRRFFVAPSFEIYGSAAGLFDFGPNGCAVKNELEAYWRRHFVQREGLFEVCLPNLTPHAVLKASGHVDRFQDLMCEDVVTKECYRADKVIEETLSSLKTKLNGEGGECTKKVDDIERTLNVLEGMSSDEMYEVMKQYGVKATSTGNELSRPFPFNLMFSTKFGPKPVQDGSGTGVAYLRPETAQGIFVNFRRLLEQNGGRMPFGGACVGTSFRNEIAPRNGLLRVREFPMAEIEYFCDPQNKFCAKFGEVADLKLPLYSRERQMANAGAETQVTLREALEKGIVDNEILAYFMGRTYLFLVKVGINPTGLRFRQHLLTEMAHYASDCWDAEILTSYKWVECVGIADRSAFDLSNHSKATNVELKAYRPLAEPRIEQRETIVLNRKLIGPVFKNKLQDVIRTVDGMNPDEKLRLQEKLDQQPSVMLRLAGSADEVPIKKEYMQYSKETVTVKEEDYVPNVIEPSFGIGRIMQAIFEHAFHVRDHDTERTYLALAPLIAPIKACILPISNQPEFQPILHRLREDCYRFAVSSKMDASNASIGKRYARNDEVGIPFCVTVDFQSLKDDTVTVRELVSMEQVRLGASQVGELLKQVVNGDVSWAAVKQKHPVVASQQED